MTIPASAIAKINPGVINAGGEGLVLNALYLTESLSMPTGQVLSFAPGPSANLAQNVAAFFGPHGIAGVTIACGNFSEAVTGAD